MSISNTEMKLELKQNVYFYVLWGQGHVIEWHCPLPRKTNSRFSSVSKKQYSQ